MESDVGGGAAAAEWWWRCPERGGRPRCSQTPGAVENPQSVLRRMPELLRLADGGAYAQLQEVPPARPHYQAPQLHPGGAEDLPRNGLGSHFRGAFHEQAPQDW